MNRRYLLAATVGVTTLLALPFLAVVHATEVHVFKARTCGCCGAWVRHLRAAGFEVHVTDVDDTATERKRLGMPEQFASCHTAAVDGYVLEGHVPAVEVKRLLASRVKAIGLAVPRMPVGSPGMEVGARRDPYEVLLVDASGQASVFATYPK
ncbi:MAG: DUF411 domain-containing protein [Burkholderiaceae bacterium]|nr:DUF411 domain-containing protein [Burkholderiaceae bacterium]